jgi:replicative DNA helicase
MPADNQVLPQAIDAEQSVLGAIMQSRDALRAAMGTVRAEHFFALRHRQIFEAIRRLYELSVAIDLITVSAELSNRGLLDEIGGRRYLMDLTDSVVTFSNIADHCRLIIEAAAKNRIISECTAIINQAYDNSVSSINLNEQISDLQKSIAPAERASIVTCNDSIAESYRELEDIHRGIVDPGIATGFADFDKATSGLHKGDLVIIGARPKVGKTSLATNILDHVASREHKSVLFFSLEMGHRAIRQRLLCSHAQVSFHKVRSRRASDDDFAKLKIAADELKAVDFAMIGAGSMNIRDIVTAAVKYKHAHGVDLIAIDYIQRIIGQHSDNRNSELTHISGALKGMAIDLDIPVIALAQLNRDVERRGQDSRPRASDLRDSGVLEQDADLVALLHRERDSSGLLTSAADLIIDMQRNGPPDVIHLHFNADTMRFCNAVKDSKITRKYIERGCDAN